MKPNRTARPSARATKEPAAAPGAADLRIVPPGSGAGTKPVDTHKPTGADAETHRMGSTPVGTPIDKFGELIASVDECIGRLLIPALASSEAPACSPQQQNGSAGAGVLS